MDCRRDASLLIVRPQGQRSLALRFLLAGVVIAVAALFSFAYSLYLLDARRVSFEGAVWQTSAALAREPDPGCIRGGMAADLVATEALVGMQQEQVLLRLGEPDRATPDELIYALGQCHGAGWWHSELVVVMSELRQATRTLTRPTRSSR